MTGRTDRIIQSGRVPERRKASIRRSRLIAFLRRWPDEVRTSTWSDRASSSRSIRWMMSRTASAPIPACRIRPPRAPLPYFASRSRKFQPSSDVSGRVIIGASRSISSRVLRISSFRPSASVRRRSRSASSSASIDSSRSAIRAAVARSSSASRDFSSSPIRSISAAAILRRRAVASRPPLSPAATTTSPVGSKAIVSSAGPVPRAARAASTAWAAAATPSVRSVRWLSRSARVLARAWFSSSFWRLSPARSSSSRSARALPPRPPRPSASSSSWRRARWRASSSTWVTMYRAKYRIRSRLRGLMSSRMPSRLGVPLKYQMWLTGEASWMWPIRSRRTLLRVTSTPHLSQMMPLYRIRLYLPQ